MSPLLTGALLHEERGGWLLSSQRGAAGIIPAEPPGGHILPAVLDLVVIAVGVVLSFVVFW